MHTRNSTSPQYQRAGAHKTISRNRSHKVSPNCHKFLSRGEGGRRTLQCSSNFQPFPLKPSSPLEYRELLRAAFYPPRGSILASIQTKIIFPGNSCNRRRGEQFRRYFRSLIHRQIEVRLVSLQANRILTGKETHRELLSTKETSRLR